MTVSTCKHRLALNRRDGSDVWFCKATEPDEGCAYVGEESECAHFEPVAPSPAWGSSYYGADCRYLGSLFVDGWHDYWLAPSMMPAKWSILIRYGPDSREVVYYCDQPGNRVLREMAGFYVAAEALWQSEKAGMNKEEEV